MVFYKRLMMSILAACTATAQISAGRHWQTPHCSGGRRGRDLKGPACYVFITYYAFVGSKVEVQTYE
jgi:hypothetical protein